MLQVPLIPNADRAAKVAGDFYNAEVISNLRRMITVLIYQNQLARRIGMVSTLRREGVTYSTLALGAVLASDLAVRVCAVDLNWYAPGLLAQAQPRKRSAPASRGPGWWPFRRTQGGPGGSEPEAAPIPGVAEVLTGKISLEKALIATEMPGFSILPAGDLDDRERALVARSQILKELLDDIGTRFDYVLLDIPALLYTSDAIALASLSDTVCMVVRQGVTSTNSVRLALDEIKHLKMLGVILNQVRVYTPQLIRQFIPQE